MKSEMLSYFRRLTRTQLIVLCLFACVGFTSLAVKARFGIAGGVAGVQDPNQQRVEVEIVTLRQWGFEPKEIARPKGQFRLAVNNQSQLAEQLTFSLVEESGRKLKDVKSDSRGKHKWNGIFDLNPGKYQLIVNERPEWICRIDITPR